jgi:hypothetical protein
MWQITTKRLLVATFWLGVSFAACLIETNEPYHIVLAGAAITFAVLTIVGWPQSERRAILLTVAVLSSSIAIIGIVFAVLAR